MPVQITRKRADIPDRHVDMAHVSFLAYLNAAREAYPHFTFIRTGPSIAWVIASPDDLYAVAKITYDDVRIRGGDGLVKTYNVFSRTIENKAVRTDREERYLRKSTAMDKAIKDIGRYVKPLTNRELVALASVDVNDALHAFFGKIVALRDRKRREIGVVPGTPAAQYILRLGREKMDTLPPELAAVAEFVEAHDMVEQFDLSARDVRAVVLSNNGAFVLPRPIYTRYDGIPALMTTSGSFKNDYQIYDLADVPQVIQDRVNVLNITGGMEFIPDVGVKHSDKVFYVVI